MHSLLLSPEAATVTSFLPIFPESLKAFFNFFNLDFVKITFLPLNIKVKNNFFWNIWKVKEG